MASRFYDCICGRFATINMIAWITGMQVIECRCGRRLHNDSLLGFNLDTAEYAWGDFMRKELKEEYEHLEPTDVPIEGIKFEGVV